MSWAHGFGDTPNLDPKEPKTTMNDFTLDETLVKVHDELSRWQTPADFIAKVDLVDELLKSPVLFNKSNINFVFDALTLAAFIALRPTAQVRLAGPREQWPDGFVGSPKAYDQIEITEVLEPGRHRGREYRWENINKHAEPDRPAGLAQTSHPNSRRA